jgi:geranylgeranyl pyrophosphate synthase
MNHKLISEIQDFTSKNIEIFFKKYLPSDLYEVYHYAIFPTGKLIRPLMSQLCYLDNINTNQKVNINLLDKNIIYFSNFLEIHHNYTLLHDDLPCMDDDQYRRNKLCTHVKYSEWEALLAGDGLLNLSYQSLNCMNHTYKNHITSLSAYCLGPKGLILGQYYDLKNIDSQNLEGIILTHKLKTARLFQLALVGGFLLSIKLNDSKKSDHVNKAKTLWRVGEYLGILFQLFDDLLELFEDSLKDRDHELKVNPFIQNTQNAFNELNFYSEKLNSSTDTLDSCLLKDYILFWVNSVNQKIKDNTKSFKNNFSVINKYTSSENLNKNIVKFFDL